ncbi:AAA family ATPase [Desulfococcaceae bacterium HSG8]|nr:AAA family ATPase [Desulfococcaceae bacterium HSG8]
MSKKSDENLSQLLEREKQLPVKDALSVQTDILNAIKTAYKESHSGGIITPDNIFVTSEDGGAMLSDLNPEPVNHIRRTYLAPECFWDIYLPASDVFSTGIILYQMITGDFPWKYDFEAVPDDPEDIVTKIFEARKNPPRRPSFYNDSCDTYLDEIILKAISTDLEKRYKTADEFLDALTSGKKAVDTVKHPGSVSSDGSPLRAEKKKGRGFDDVAGMKDIKDALYQDVILPLTEKSLYEEYKITVPSGMLLYGPPGCGKTFISQKFAEEIEYSFVQVKPSDLASIYVHGTQEKIGHLFKEARETAPSIIFIDEVDAVLPNRQGGLYHSYASEVNEFLAQMTECYEDGIFIIAATNCPERIDPAILRTGRMDKVFYVEPPDSEARVEMFGLYLKDRPTDSDIDLEILAGLSENYVASDIKFMVNEASRNALKERAKISQNHLEDVIKKTSPSVSENQIRKYETFKNSRVFV